MTTQTLTRSSSETAQNSASKSDLNTLTAQGSASYQAIQQLKYLHLQLEIDVLLQELQTIKQNKQASITHS
ncbi:hypothetical protein PCC8801_3981 [Rippkaea orientalis PCC 8801]|uniref:Uncharacterized protein n=1 Tax=Rippkaea orientalis (strain PCC 8801 / RF-1) TaxID=41431 RepID=B7K594_RIPO1|nr:hypothetical protein [Rippkaea orientalis]ACK67920.1 hypothetical protein PCC8801_3981 [Rippkaea orientalis PCC 8801]